jgi:hypothetical protein
LSELKDETEERLRAASRGYSGGEFATFAFNLWRFFTGAALGEYFNPGLKPGDKFDAELLRKGIYKRID